MVIKLLNKGYIGNEQFYRDFLENKLMDNQDYISDEEVIIGESPNFPIYLNVTDEEERARLFHEAFDIISKSYINLDQDIYLDEVFWHSLLCLYKRDFLLQNYPEIKEDIKIFNNIVLKKFNWENYIYKCVLAAQYVNDHTREEDERKKYYQLVIDNLDLYNYIIKSDIFRNQNFLINVLDICHEHDLSKILKAGIKNRPDLGKDERVGRRVIFEFNKSYPIIMSPMLEKSELEPLFLEYLSYYVDMGQMELAS